MIRIFVAAIIIFQIASPSFAAELVKHASWNLPGPNKSALAFVIGGKFSAVGAKGFKSVALMSGADHLDDIDWKTGGYVAKHYIVTPGDYFIEAFGTGRVIRVTAEPQTIHYIGLLAVDPAKQAYEIEYIGKWSAKAQQLQEVAGLPGWAQFGSKELVTYIEETKVLDPTYQKLGLRLKPIWPIPPPDSPTPQQPDPPENQ